MFLILFALLILSAYAGTGVFYSRANYANVLAASKQKASDFKEIARNKEKIVALELAYQEMTSTRASDISKHHTRSCDKYTYSHIGVCNCGANKKNRAALAQLKELVEGKVDEPDVIKPAMLWPGYMLTNFMKSGESTDKDLVRRTKEIEEARHYAELAELRAIEAAALDRELELARKDL